MKKALAVPPDDGLITQPAAAELLGNVSMMTMWRWRTNPAMRFPESTQINGRHYFRRGDILGWRPPPKPQPGRRQGHNAA
jgi:hypothetical protein